MDTGSNVKVKLTWDGDVSIYKNDDQIKVGGEALRDLGVDLGIEEQVEILYETDMKTVTWETLHE